MQERILTLEAQLRAVQLEKEQQKVELRDAQSQAGAEKQDRGVETEASGDPGRDEAAKELLESLSRVESVVGRALQVAQLLTEEQSKVKKRLEAINRRVEEAVSRATHTQNQLGALETRMSNSTLSSDISMQYNAIPEDSGSSAVGSRGIVADPDLESVSSESQHSSSPRPTSPNTGGTLLPAAAEDNSHTGCDSEEASQDTEDSPDSSDPWVNRLSTVISQLSSPADLLPVGLVCEGSPPEQNTCERASAAAHSPLPETSPPPGPACEELAHGPTWENVAGSEEPDRAEGSPSKLEESESSRFILEEGDSRQTASPEPNKRPKSKQEDSERRRSQDEAASCGRSELDPGGGKTDSKLIEKGQATKTNNQESLQALSTADLQANEGAKTSGSSEEEPVNSERNQEETGSNSVLKEPQIISTCHTKEEFEASQVDSVQDSQLQTADSVGALKRAQDISAVCGGSGSAVKQASPRVPQLVVPESDTPFIFPHTRSRPPATPTMPTLPEEEEDSPEEVDSSSSSPSSYVPVETKLMNVSIAPPAIVLPRQQQDSKQEPLPLEKARPHSPRPRLSRTSGSSGPITTVDNDGHVIDLVKDQLPEMQLSEQDRQKNLELLEEAKKVSDRFLTRRGRRSTCSLTESPTALSPNPTPGSSPVPSRSSSLSAPPQTEVTIIPPISQPISQRLEVPAVRDHGETSKPEQESLKRLVDWKPPEKRKVSSGTLTPRHAAAATVREPSVAQKDSTEPFGPVDRGKMPGSSATAQKPDNQTPATGVAKPVPRPPTQQAPCTAEIKTIGAFPPLMRAVSWDTVGSMNMRNGAPKGDEDLSFTDKLKSTGYKDFPAPPIQKLSKLREEHKLIRNQSISGSKLPDLSEMAEQERGPASPTAVLSTDEESKEKADAMPNISDVMLRKLKLHRGLPGCAPPLTEKEVENAFVQLSLAFRNDNYTLETRLKQAERERNLTEDNTEKELEEFKNSLKGIVSLWQNAEQRESYQRLIETLAVLHRLANRLSSRAEMVGAVRQEKRMNKATEVMLQYVENLKRTYEKDHAELMEFKKLANQNSNRCSSIETGDDGVPRASRSMSLTMGKALPRRRVSVAVVPKFNLLNIPGQTPATAGAGPGALPGAAPGPGLASGGSSTGPGALPVLCEANSVKIETPSDPAQPATGENGKVQPEQEGEAAAPAKASCSLEEIRAEIKAKIEEEAYNKGYQEGLKRLKELQEVKEEEEKAEEKLIESEEITGEDFEKEKKPNSRYEEALEVLDRICPKIFKRNRTLWIILTLFLVTFLLVNLVNLFSYHYSVQGDTSAEKSAIPGKKKFLGLHVGSKSPTPE
ncbi:inositol 1,4,5-triphosphate receptor associated 1 [Astyanax mexicanus]|uniref:inositol 1,4,5-triphosphate receptor associated 1 n=1 Tax=Astyanax mexicanus TaxID=7994 RepID=UPI0020CB3830|nr:inositol 1,4,5-triphosphate receptor associated 1 [Astyanax mexicanus]